MAAKIFCLNFGAIFFFFLGMIVMFLLLSIQDITVKLEVPVEKKSHLIKHKMLLKAQMTEVVKMVNKANMYVRGTKTSDRLKEALTLANSLLQQLEMNYDQIIKRKTYYSTNICPEYYINTTIGFPRYYKGFFVENCDYSKPLHKLITIVMNTNHYVNISAMLNSIDKNLANVKVIINIQDSTVNIPKYSWVTITQKRGNESAIWNHIIQKVETPFTLVTRDVILFNSDAALDRLIREVDRLGLAAVGGAYRNLSGHWFMGCQQSVLRNYTLVYEAGYFESIHECAICDHIDGPFVIKTDKIKNLQFAADIRGEGLFEDFFLRLHKTSKSSAVCPDSMFFTDRRERVLTSASWESFGRKWNLVSIEFSGRKISIGCPDDYKCGNISNEVPSPCCVKEQADLIAFVSQICALNNIWCEVDSRILLGTLKSSSVLPRRLHSHISGSVSTDSVMKTVQHDLSQHGFNISKHENNSYRIFSKNFYCDLQQKSILAQIEDLGIKFNQTKININGQWVPTVKNPGLFLRNQYGYNYFQHNQILRKTANDESINEFLKCRESKYHACVNRYNADGNLQFRYYIP